MAMTSTDHFGIVIFSHLHWGIIWQRLQQSLSRLAQRHPVLFVEEPRSNVAEGKELRVEMHPAMPNFTVACPHAPESMSGSSQMTLLLCAGRRSSVSMRTAPPSISPCSGIAAR